jgi:hypothetical protein
MGGLKMFLHVCEKHKTKITTRTKLQQQNHNKTKNYNNKNYKTTKNYNNKKITKQQQKNYNYKKQKLVKKLNGGKSSTNSKFREVL